MLNTLTQIKTSLDDQLRSVIVHFAGREDIILLDTQDDGVGYLAVGFKRKLICRESGCEVLFQDGGKIETPQHPWEALQEFRKQGGWSFGYLGYDLKNYTEKLSSHNKDAVQAPDLVMSEPRSLYQIDRKNGLITKIYGDDLPDVEAEHEIECEVMLHDEAAQFGDFVDGVKIAQKDIFMGDYYEVNLSRQVEGQFSGKPFCLYEKMKNFGPVPFGAFLQWGDMAVCCASPERFLKKTGNLVLSEPIKGTAAVSEDESVNKAILAELQASEKNRAENLMIVDLVRNDLNRIAVPGTVKTEELFAIHRFRSVFQMISKITGQVKPDVSSVDVIKACFPMGSMTGAPKISAMEAIERIENYKRGIYSGAIGYFTPNDDFDFNVVIRSAVIKGDKLFYSTGGAITADSDPNEEWEETRIKMRALTRSV